MSNKQRLSDFLVKPFGTPVSSKELSDLNAKYSMLALSSGVKLHAVCVVEDSYYYHIKVDSSSQKSGRGNYQYDVIVRFFTDSPQVEKEHTLDNYFVQFYSNSPSFMYTYAYVYKQNGYLIDALYNKLDPDYIDTPPAKTNASERLCYDKSIYSACRYLMDKRNHILVKNGTIRLKMKSPLSFFAGINDFRSTKMDRAIISEEKKLSKNLKKEKPNNTSNKNEKKTSSISTFKDKEDRGIRKVAKITGIKSRKAKKRPGHKT